MNNKGFTLIELLVVIAIISLLSSIVMASLGSAKDKAKLAKVFETMNNMNKTAYMCADKGYELNPPVSNGVGGTSVCSPDAALVPNISDTGFIYCGQGCGGWYSNTAMQYAFSAYSDSFPGGRKIVVCGSNINRTGWFYENSPFDLTNQFICKKSGF